MARKTKAGPNQLAFDFSVIVEELFQRGCIQSISKALPMLYATQHEDVLRAERRYEVGKGYLFTNGTGTGKTFVGLGVAYRFIMDGKMNQLIVVPTEQKAKDWIEEAEVVGLKITLLKDTNDGGEGVCVTTYANYYQNEGISKRDWDLVTYDESHYLMQNVQGKGTKYLDKHKSIAKLPSYCKTLAWNMCGEPPEYREHDRDAWADEAKLWKENLRATVEKLVDSTKVLFLSATPFAYHKSIKYADGCLWDIYETIEEQEDAQGYNDTDAWESFMVKHFGYRMRTNRLTTPESGVDMDLMERMFFENMKKKGVMSTRQLQLPYDYSRDFIVVDSTIGNKINEGMELFYDSDFRKEYKYLTMFSNKKYNYLYMNQLLECIKAQEVLDRLEQHIALDRKIVIFHGYNNAAVAHPFHFDVMAMLKTQDDKYYSGLLIKDIMKFEQNYPELINLNLDSLHNIRKTIKDRFPQAVEFNGTVSKKKRSKNILDFNTDWNDTNILVVQEKAGREGISLHQNKQGGQQRVLVNLGLPTAPTTAIQTEGRIYRSGLLSDAMYEYIILNTPTERIAFANKIAERAKTAENLAMGLLARDLEGAYKNGYIEAHSKPPSLEQGKGGKDKDRKVLNISEYDRAISYYYSRQKRSSSNKSKEGIDYFATPEPFGLKMVQWFNIDYESDRTYNMLEPSCGHGAIGRWFTKATKNVFIEPSLQLLSEASINCDGDTKRERFEDYYVGNKFEFIAMNPPFGIGGKTAIEHLTKAVKHLGYRGGVIHCIIPAGPMCDKRFNQMLIDFDGAIDFTGEILLPNITFERAGTKVATRMVRLSRTYGNPCQGMQNRIDLRHIEDVNEFFDEIEHLDF